MALFWRGLRLLLFAFTRRLLDDTMGYDGEVVFLLLA
jgi:hypothetical protein